MRYLDRLFLTHLEFSLRNGLDPVRSLKILPRLLPDNSRRKDRLYFERIAQAANQGKSLLQILETCGLPKLVRQWFSKPAPAELQAEILRAYLTQERENSLDRSQLFQMLWICLATLLTLPVLMIAFASFIVPQFVAIFDSMGMNEQFPTTLRLFYGFSSFISGLVTPWTKALFWLAVVAEAAVIIYIGPVRILSFFPPFKTLMELRQRIFLARVGMASARAERPDVYLGCVQAIYPDSVLPNLNPRWMNLGPEVLATEAYFSDLVLIFEEEASHFLMRFKAFWEPLCNVFNALVVVVFFSGLFQMLLGIGQVLLAD